MGVDVGVAVGVVSIAVLVGVGVSARQLPVQSPKRTATKFWLSGAASSGSSEISPGEHTSISGRIARWFGAPVDCGRKAQSEPHLSATGR